MTTSTVPLQPLAATPNGDGPHAKLGEHTYPVYAQRHAYLMNKLGKQAAALASLGEGDSLSSVDNAVSMLGERVYGILKVLIPQLMPEYEFRGYATVEAMEKDEYQEEYDKSPSVPEVIDAVQLCLKVNRLDLAAHLGKIVDLDMVRAFVNSQLANSFEATLSRTSS